MNIAATRQVKTVQHDVAQYSREDSFFEEVFSRVNIAFYRLRLGDGYGFARGSRFPPRLILSDGTKHSMTGQAKSQKHSTLQQQPVSDENLSLAKM